MLVLIVLFFLFLRSISTAVDSSFHVSGQYAKYHCVDNERQALLLFKADIIDDDGVLSSWSSKDDNKNCCKWRGVECNNQTGHVIKLDLHSQHMTGKISHSLLQLPHLNYLDLGDNNFSYQLIPNFIGSLTQLNYLDLSFNNIVGTIPSQLGNLSHLQYLDLSYNYLLVENLEWLSHLSSLEHLNMDFVDISKAIHWVDIINSLPLLSHVGLADCQLSSVVYPYLSLINSSTPVTNLDLSRNDLTSSMYHWLFNLSTTLVNLSLNDNQLKGPIPEGFGKMTSLASLDLSFNQLQSVGIPKSFGNLCSLQSLHLHDNNISGNLADFLHNLSGCTDATLEELYVHHNKLTGSLPDSIVKFSSLKTLDLFHNQLNGTVSENLGTLSKLEFLDLSFNSLQGVLLESHFLNLPSLSLLDLSFNSLRLEVSSQWIPQFQLISIGLNSCKIGPRFPEWIQNQKNLSYLDIANCGISENIPSSLWDQLMGLTYIDLSENKIRGKVPDFPSNFGINHYPEIDLSSNLFEGQIPLLPSSSIGINLSKNKFTGSLSLLCWISDKELLFLDLSHNLLTGALPDCLMQFRNLVELNVAQNRLLGKIPASIGYLFQLNTLNLYNNSFFGELPLSLRNCRGLRFLNLGANKFSGNVPSRLVENLQSLYALSLRSNNLSGIIPLQLCYLPNLQILDLSLNNLFGRIPPCLNNLTAIVKNDSSLHVLMMKRYEGSNAMEYQAPYLDIVVVKWQGKEMDFEKQLGLLKIIDLSSNQLTGEIPDAITSLLGLVVLDLSSNKLHGKIPKEIGQLRLVLSLNLSRNEFSGNIPASMSMLSLLNNLDLSDNNFSGRIPTGTQLQSFNASSYVGNFGLCGPPLPLKCPGDKLPPAIVDNGDYQEDNDGFWKWFYIGTVIGFINGFWGICGVLLLNRTCRHFFFRFIDKSMDCLYVKIAMRITKIQR